MNIGLVIEPTAAHLSHYLKSLKEIPGVTAVFAADTTGQTEKNVRDVFGPRLIGFYRDIDVLLEAAAAPIVILSLEAHRSPPAIAQCVQAGCHVLAEKPACVRVQDFEAIAELARARGLQLMLAFANRSAPMIQDARRIVQEGRLGRLYSVQCHTVADQTRVQRQSGNPSWYFRKEHGGGGHLAWLGIHAVDWIQHVCGTSIVEVSGYAGNVGGAAVDVEDSAVVSFRCANGMFGSLTSGYYIDRGKHISTSIWGEKGWMWLSPSNEPKLVWQEYAPAGQAPTAPQVIDYSGRNVDAYLEFIREAIHAAAGKSPFPLTTEESLRAIQVVFAAYESAASGRRQGIAQ